ncbi:MAG: hypothetical protein Q7S13_06615, partial [Candidatus Omnitrophota bacterium]|nr:hypothetical protein [Candidatus Omnitrophota bacterium]
MRLKIIRISVIILFLLIAGDLLYVQVIRGNYYYNLSKNNRVRIVPLGSWRGLIFDRNGVVLADNRLGYNVLITPQEVKDLNEVFVFLEDVLGINEKKLTTTYQNKKTAPFAPIVLKENISREQALMIEENRYRFPSLFVQENFERVYPFNDIGAHVLG